MSRAIVLLIGAALAAGCAEQVEPPPPQPPVALKDAASVVSAGNGFAFNLYAALRPRGGNLFFSPESAATALSMVWCGARGETARQMQAVLGYGTDAPVPPEAIAAAYRAHLEQLAAPPREHELVAANAVWGQKGYAFQGAYLGLLRIEYGAPLQEADFAGNPEAARHAINRWTGEQTRGLITDISPPGFILPETRLVLVSAIYFKARWQRPFESWGTRDGPFHVGRFTRISVPMMHQVESLYGYAEDERVQVLEMPYRGGDASMVVILPKERFGLADVEKTLSAAQVAAWVSRIENQEVKVTVPKFKATSAFSLRKTLSSLGMPLVFAWPGADLSGMNGGREALFLQDALHQAFVAVDEEGTEAAAATGAAMPACAPPRRPPPEFIADHPFLFLIRDTRSGCILFMGRLANPKE